MGKSTTRVLLTAAAVLLVMLPCVDAQFNYCAYLGLIYTVLLGCPDSNHPLCGVLEFFETSIFTCYTQEHQPLELERSHLLMEILKQ